MCPNCRYNCESSSEADFQCCPKRKTVDFDCNIYLQKASCSDKKREKREQIREACRQHRQRIKELSTPRRTLRPQEPEKCPGRPLDELIPRLSQLSRPRWCTPKYIRPKSEEFCLPGVITDWEALVFYEHLLGPIFQSSASSSHKKWAAKRAKPKKDFSTMLQAVRASRCAKTKITCEGMQRIERLAKPRSRYMRCKAKPSSRDYHSRCYGYATERILELSEPKPRVEQNNDFRPLSQVLKVSKSAKEYEATERIRYLAIPRIRSMQMKKEVADKLMCRTFSCHENLRLNSRSSDRELNSA